VPRQDGPAISSNFFAEIHLLVALSACPGGQLGASHSGDSARWHPLKVEGYRPRERALAG